MMRSTVRDWRRLLLTTGTLGAMTLLGGCTREGRFQAISMWNESRLKPYEGSPVPGEASSSRRPPAGAIARGSLAVVDPMRTGRSDDGKLLTRPPMAVTAKVLERGQERFNVYCTPCHSRTGDGAGLVALRGFPAPPDYGLVRLRQAPIGHFYDVVTNGYGIMYSYADRLSVEDRWAVAAYLRVLQKKRPVVKKDEGLAAREKARLTGIPPTSGMNLGRPGDHPAAPHAAPETPQAPGAAPGMQVDPGPGTPPPPGPGH